MDLEADQNRRAFAARAEADKAGRDPIKLGEWLVDMTERAYRAEARVNELETQLELSYQWIKKLDENIEHLHTSAEKAEAQNAKLREALRDTVWRLEMSAALHGFKNTSDGDAEATIDQAQARLLRAALAEE